MDFRETFQELWAGCVYLFDKTRGREPSADRAAKRAGYFENAFSRPRPPQRFRRAKEIPSSSRSPPPRSKNEKDPLYVQVEREVNVDGQRQWLGNVYGLELMHMERSEGLEAQFERELVKRGYAPTRALPERSRDPERLNNSAQLRKPEPQPSWWRNIYKRLSQSDPDAEEPPSLSNTPPRSRRISRSRRSPRSGQQPLVSNYPANLEDLPPRSILGTYQRQHKEGQKNHSPRGPDVDGDVLMPLPRIASPSRSAHRQNLPMVTVDRESILSLAVNHPFPSVEGNQSYLAPVSSHASRYGRADSLLGRLFPDTMTEGDSMSMTDFGTVGDGTQSILSMSTDAVGQARKTPRARLTTNTPQIMTRGTVLDSTGPRALLQPVPEQVQPSQELPDPLAAELLVPDRTSPLNQTYSDERKVSIHRRPLPSPPSLSPPHGAEDLQLPVTRTIRHHTSRDDLDILPLKHPGNSHDLRRSNARARPRSATSPPEAQHFSTIHSFEIPRVPDHTYAALGRPSPQNTAGSLSSGQISPSHSSSSMLLRPGLSRKPLPPMRDIGYQAASDTRGYNPSRTPERNLVPSRHRTRDAPAQSSSQLNPPSPHSPSSSRASRPPYPQAAKPFSTINRLRKHQEGKHARSPVSSDDNPSFSSRSSQATSGASRSPTHGHTNGSHHGARTWRTIDYPSSSWYIPVNPDS
ncbi:hypothetical protein APHAL10511_003745 [Amanita phalloides]|nr:hypothetical protein APHAL10511_003745 [Amanita phalloides]